MKIDFKAEFAGRTDDELRQVLAHPSEYTSEALAAAESILRSRGVEPAEPVLVQSAPTFVPVPATPAGEEEDILTDLLEQPSDVARPAGWVAVLFIIVCVYQCWSCYLEGKSLVLTDGSDPSALGLLVSGFAFDVLTLICLIKRTRWGWLLFATGVTITATVQLAQTVMLLAIVKSIGWDAVGWLPAFVLVLRLAILVLWSQNGVMRLFRVPDHLRTRPFAVGFGLAVLFAAAYALNTFI